jgi:hypothetical protein
LAEKVENFFFPLSSLPSAFVRFSTRGVQKHDKHFLGETHVKNLWPKKLRGGKKIPFVFSHRLFFIAFLAVSLHLHEEPKNTKKIFSQIRPGNLKKVR